MQDVEEWPSHLYLLLQKLVKDVNIFYLAFNSPSNILYWFGTEKLFTLYLILCQNQHYAMESHWKREVCGLYEHQVFQLLVREKRQCWEAVLPQQVVRISLHTHLSYRSLKSVFMLLLIQFWCNRYHHFDLFQFDLATQLLPAKRPKATKLKRKTS